MEFEYGGNPWDKKGLLTKEGVRGGSEWGSGVLKGVHERKDETMQTHQNDSQPAVFNSFKWGNQI